jgi:multidrug efflux system membrane fusion protein
MKRILLLLLVILAACSKEESKKFEMPPTVVQTAEVEVRDLPLYFESLGTIQPSLSAEVKSQVSGEITGIHFTEGQLVRKGDLLYTIDEASYEIRAREAQAHLVQDQAHLANEMKKLERYKSLSKPGLIAQVEWDELYTQIALREAMVKGDEAKLASAQLDLEHCNIVAPIDGLVGKTALQAGNRTNEQSLVKISQMDHPVVDFEITLNEREKLPLKPLIEIYMIGKPELLASGHVTFLDHGIEPKSGMISAQGVLTELKAPLWSNERVIVKVIFGKQIGAHLIPLRAVKTNQSGPYVFLVKEDHTVEMRPLQLGPEEKGFVVVDLDGGTVVTEGHGRLFPGSKVEEAK